MEHWTEMRTALLVAQLGTVSAAANALGVHRATVNRHIDTLEEGLKTSLFYRHARGYSLTETGQELLEASARIDTILTELTGRIQGKKELMTGELIITSVAPLSALVMPAIARYVELYPNSPVRFQASADLADLEYGEAHIALRAGPKPTNPDYVVLPFKPIVMGLYASQNYDLGQEPENWAAYRYVGSDSYPPDSCVETWTTQNVSPKQVALFSNNAALRLQAVRAGLGLGWLLADEAALWPDLVPVLEPIVAFENPIWFVSHADMHRTAKVQAFKELLFDES